MDEKIAFGRVNYGRNDINGTLQLGFRKQPLRALLSNRCWRIPVLQPGGVQFLDFSDRANQGVREITAPPSMADQARNSP